MTKWDNLYMTFCYEIAKLSYAKNLKVGTVVVKDKNILCYGYNGTPSGFDNECEDSNNKTLPYVIHAEINALSKALKQGISVNEATIYCNICPCAECAKVILQSGIKTVIYKDDYRDNTGKDILIKGNIEVIQWDK